MRITIYIYEVSEGMIHVMDSSTFCCSARLCSWFRRTFIRKSLTSSRSVDDKLEFNIEFEACQA